MPEDHSRRSSRLRRDFLRAAVGIGTATALGGCIESLPGAGGDVKNTFTFVTGPSDTMAFALGNQLSSQVKQNSEMTMDVKSSASASQSVVQLLTGKTELAYGAALTGIRAKNGEGNFGKVNAESELMQMMSYYWIRTGLVAKTSSDIETYGDLDGKSFTVGSADFSFFDPMQAVFDQYLSGTEMEHKSFSLTQMGSALSSDKVHAAGGPLYINGLTPSYVQKLYSQNDVRLLGWDQSVIDEVKNDPRVSGADVKNSKLEGVTEFTSEPTTFMPSSNSVWYANDTMPEQSVYDLMNTVWEIRSDLPDAHAGFGPWTEDDFWTTNLTTELPVHPGAAKFLEEKDLWDDDYDVGEL